MESFHLLLGLWPKDIFNKMFLIFTKEFNIDLENRKWNYFANVWTINQITVFQYISLFHQGVQNCFQKQKMELSKQEMELFLQLQGL